MESESSEFRFEIKRIADFSRIAIELFLVVVDEQDEMIELSMSGKLDRFPALAFVQLTIPDYAVGVVAASGKFVPVGDACRGRDPLA